MWGMEVPVRKYVVRLTEDERCRLEEIVRKGKSPAERLLKARILLKADVSELGEGWSEGEIIAVLDTNAAMVYRPRKQLAEEGFEAALSRKHNGRRHPSREFSMARKKRD